MIVSSLFQIRGAATTKARSPTVESLVVSQDDWLKLADRSLCRLGRLSTRTSEPRQCGTFPFHARLCTLYLQNVSFSASKKGTRLTEVCLRCGNRPCLREISVVMSPARAMIERHSALMIDLTSRSPHQQPQQSWHRSGQQLMQPRISIRHVISRHELLPRDTPAARKLCWINSG